MNNLRKIRGKLGYTQQQLANELKISRRNITSMEKYLTVEKAKTCAKFFNVNPIEILGSDILKVEPTSKEELEMIINNLKETYYDLA